MNRGEDFADRLLEAFTDAQDGPRLVHVATDGETYGHHHRYGDMALAYALHHIESNGLAKITNYGEYLEAHPPIHEVRLIENTSWSCAHGIERWRGNCGCNSGGHSGWNQEWRAPLREALDWLWDTLAPLYEGSAKTLLNDPWKARNDYIDVILDRSPENVERFLSKYANRELSQEEKSTALKLLELQRHAMLMYTSCGWFFDELSGIETVQVIQYAGRAIQLSQQLFGNHIEDEFLDLLAQAKSNLPEHGDGRLIYEKFVKPAQVDWEHLGAHYAISSQFEEYGEHTALDAYEVDVDDSHSLESGRTRLTVGRARFTSNITQESASLTFGVLHFGDHNINCGVREFQGDEAYQTLNEEIREAYNKSDLPEVLRLMDKHFGGSTYSLRTLFRDEQHKILNQIVDSTLTEAETAYRHIYATQNPLIYFMTDLGIPAPKTFLSTAEFYINTDLWRAFSADTLDVERIKALMEEAKTLRTELDAPGLGYTLTHTLEAMMDRFVTAPEDVALLSDLASAVELALSLPFEVILWKLQNLYFDMLRTTYPEYQMKAQQQDESAGEWVTRFATLGDKLSVKVV